MVAGLVQAGELQLPVEVQAHVPAVLGQDDLLVPALLVVDDRVAVGPGVDAALEVAGAAEQRHEHHDRRRPGGHQPAGRVDVPEHHHGHGHVERPDEVGAPQEPQLRQEHEGEDQRGDERAEVVQRQDPAEQLDARAAAELGEGLDEQRDLQADEDADEQADGAEDPPVDAGEPEGGVEDEDRVAAHQAQEDLVGGEDGGGPSAQAAGQQRAGPHAEQRDAGGQAEAEHRVADEVGGRRAQDELVDEPADGDQEGGRE